MDIIAVKKRVRELEQAKKRLPVYEYLRGLWQEHSDSAELATLVLHQMVFHLEELELPGRVCEHQDEYNWCYELLQDVLRVGLQRHREDRYFLWSLCFFLTDYPHYHYLLGPVIPPPEATRVLEDLLALADQRYPDSMMFRVISYQQEWPFPPWQDAYSEAELATLTAEMQAWHLQDNVADDEIKWWFRDR